LKVIVGVLEILLLDYTILLAGIPEQPKPVPACQTAAANDGLVAATT